MSIGHDTHTLPLTLDHHVGWHTIVLMFTDTTASVEIHMWHHSDMATHTHGSHEYAAGEE